MFAFCGLSCWKPFKSAGRYSLRLGLVAILAFGWSNHPKAFFTPEFLKELMTQASLLHDKLDFMVFRTEETLKQAHYAYSLIEIWANCAWMRHLPQATAALAVSCSLASGQPGTSDSDE